MCRRLLKGHRGNRRLADRPGRQITSRKDLPGKIRRLKPADKAASARRRRRSPELSFNLGARYRSVLRRSVGQSVGIRTLLRHPGSTSEVRPSAKPRYVLRGGSGVGPRFAPAIAQTLPLCVMNLRFTLAWRAFQCGCLVAKCWTARRDVDFTEASGQDFAACAWMVESGNQVAGNANAAWHRDRPD